MSSYYRGPLLYNRSSRSMMLPLRELQSRWRPQLRYLGLALLGVVLLLLYLRPRVYVPTLRGYQRANFRQRWWRVTLPFTLRAEAARKARLPKYQPPPLEAFPHFPIYVISLANATARRAAMQEEMAARHIKFEWFDAVDGTREMPLDLVKWYLGGKRLQEYLASKPGSLWHRYMACNLSHLRLMHKLLADGEEMQLVFEDDFELYDRDGDFLLRLRNVMAQLPADWEVLWLFHGRRGSQEEMDKRKTVQQLTDEQANTWVGENVRLFVQNNWAVALLYRRSFALKVLNDAQIGNKDYDDVVNDVCSLGNAAAYTADPALVGVTTKKALKSQIRT